MREHWYRPGGDSDWVALAAPEALLAVERRDGLPVAELWSALEGGFQRVLDTLTEKGFSATPSFALLAWSETGELRAIVRGPVKLHVTSPGEERTLDGTGVSTWTEMVFGGGASFALELPGSPTSAALPLSVGAVTAVRISSDAPAEGAAAASVNSASVSAAPVSSAPVASAPPPPGATSVPETTMSDVWDEEHLAEQPYESQQVEELLGETIHRGAATSEGEAQVPVPSPAAAAEGDHDGMTIVAGDLRRMREERRAVTPAPASAVPAPAVPRLELSNGTVETLDQHIIVGRSPSASKVSGGALPRLIAIPGDKDISRNHAQFAVEGDTVVVTDLHSRNGTQIILPGRAPQQLRQGEPTTIIVGTVVDLGGGVTLTLREGA